jgi:hypothetical protein
VIERVAVPSTVYAVIPAKLVLDSDRGAGIQKFVILSEAKDLTFGE